MLGNMAPKRDVHESKVAQTPKRFDPTHDMAGGHLPLDGTIEFYGRICSILEPTDVVLNLGAGRGAWYYEEKSRLCRSLLDIKPRVRRMYAADIDPAVMKNPTSHENMLIVGGQIPLPDCSVDLLIADYVFEHVSDPAGFCNEIARVLRPGGYICARTPHRYHFVGLVARLIRNRYHASVLEWVQPKRLATDVFPTTYQLNTRRAVRRHFPGFTDQSYLYSAEPQYYFGIRQIYYSLRLARRALPDFVVSNLFVFLRKPPKIVDTNS